MPRPSVHRLTKIKSRFPNPLFFPFVFFVVVSALREPLYIPLFAPFFACSPTRQQHESSRRTTWESYIFLIRPFPSPEHDLYLSRLGNWELTRLPPTFCFCKYIIECIFTVYERGRTYPYSLPFPHFKRINQKFLISKGFKRLHSLP